MRNQRGRVLSDGVRKGATKSGKEVKRTSGLLQSREKGWTEGPKSCKGG